MLATTSSRHQIIGLNSRLDLMANLHGGIFDFVSFISAEVELLGSNIPGLVSQFWYRDEINV